MDPYIVCVGTPHEVCIIALVINMLLTKMLLQALQAFILKLCTHVPNSKLGCGGCWGWWWRCSGDNRPTEMGVHSFIMYYRYAQAFFVPCASKELKALF